MKLDIALDKSGSFVASQFHDLKQLLEDLRSRKGGPAVTISSQTGAGAHEIAEHLAGLLKETEPESTAAWAVFDRQLVEKALVEHDLPAKLADKMPEDRRTYIDDVMDDLFGLRPPSWVLVPKVIETILHLADSGHVILVGRGAAVVTARMPNVFHVRLIASLAKRIERVQKKNGLSPEAAARFVAKEDRGRRRYLKANFSANPEDDLLYHLVLNTDRIPCRDAAGVIAEAAQRSFSNRLISYLLPERLWSSVTKSQ
jgi:cytidylate kinase